jgi:hypothetical protein
MPTLGNVYTPDAALSNLATQLSARTTYICDEVAPQLPVEEISAKIYRIDGSFAFDLATDDRRAPGAPARVVDFDVDKPVSYTCEDHSLVHSIPVEVSAAMDDILRRAINPVTILTHRIMLRREINLRTALNTLGAASNPSVKWDAGSGTPKPLTDLRGWIETVADKGVRPNTITMPYKVYKVLVTSAEFISESANLGNSASDRSGFDVRKSQLLALLDMPQGSKIVVPETHLVNSANRGQTKSLGQILSDSVYITRTEEPPAGALSYAGTIIQPRWTDNELSRNAGGFTNGLLVELMYDTHTKSNMARVGTYYDLTVINADTGLRVASVLT